jgi:hypothetical protein
MHAKPFQQGLALAFLLPCLAVVGSTARVATAASPQIQQLSAGTLRRADLATTGRGVFGPGGPCTTRDRSGCGSLLVFPEYDNVGDGAVKTLATITHAVCDPDEHMETIQVEIVFVNSATCLEALNRTEELTPFDTFTFVTKAYSAGPGGTRGYFYAFARAGIFPNQNPLVFNSLIGMETVINGITTFDYSLNAISFRGIGVEGALNDDGPQTGRRDLDDATEYQGAPDQIAIPRFLGQDPVGGPYDSDIILFSLSRRAPITLSGFLCTDTGHPISFSTTFTCWEKRKLRDLDSGSSVFLNTNLQVVDDNLNDPDEIRGFPTRHAGWILLDADPEAAFYAVLIERANGLAAATLPFELCTQTDGVLLPLP